MLSAQRRLNSLRERWNEKDAQYVANLIDVCHHHDTKEWDSIAKELQQLRHQHRDQFDRGLNEIRKKLMRDVDVRDELRRFIQRYNPVGKDLKDVLELQTQVGNLWFDRDLCDFRRRFKQGEDIRAELDDLIEQILDDLHLNLTERTAQLAKARELQMIVGSSKGINDESILRYCLTDALAWNVMNMLIPKK